MGLSNLFLSRSPPSIRYFDEIFSCFNNPIILLSVTGKILKCNDIILKLYNLTKSQVIQKDYFEICQLYNIVPPFVSLKEMNETTSRTTVTTINGHSSHSKTIQWTVSAVKYKNRIEHFYLLGFDITTLTNTSIFAKQLQTSIIDHIPNHYIFWKDKNSVYLGCNTALASSLGLKSTTEIVGKTDFDLPTKKEESVAYRADDKQVMDSKQPKLNIEEPQTLPDGTKRILLTSKVPLLDENGESQGIVAIYSDITQQKLNELKLMESNQKLEKLSQVKSEFIRNISHDIRTPLAGIQQILRAIHDGTLPEEDFAEMAFSGWEASNKLMDLFNQIIDVSKKENFDFEDRIVKFDLYKLLKELYKTYEVVAKHKGLKLEIEYSENVPHYLKGKHWRLHRILLNLLGNALKFTEKGSVKLLVEKSQESNDDIILRFSVIDTGIGISKEKHEAIFEPFSRLNPAYQNKYQGSGLGLHVVKDYVEKLKGEIYVESDVGEGSMFTCILPFKRPILNNDNDVAEVEYAQKITICDMVPIKENFSEIKTSTIENTATIPLRVLLVEDDKMAQTMGLMLLRDKGYQVDLAKTGEKALELTLENSYELIYMDVGLGKGIDGIETTRRIRNNKKNLSQNAFIAALTAHADEAISKECLEAGMQRVLSKPLSPEKILQIHSLSNKSNETHETQGVIDFDLWKTRLGESVFMLEDLVHMVGQDFDKNKRDIKQSYEKHDLPTLQAVTHKLKGALLYCGFPRLETAIKKIEAAAKEGNAKKIDELYPETINVLNEAETAYKKWAKKHLKNN